ncbi:YtxH domain-containing protein [Candidatus Poribacteria bacterium]|nr:YtxH domain-containing protein [Candidatus Poribacteria bacterium]MXV82556.1 YtxH domain-containing protein [Candidatus Poribacteria bacterium]MYA58066.1 YtxH domain-containing protein [Candidatus Poribacteria bacterium]
MSNNGQNNGIAMIFAFVSGFMAGAVISLLYAPSSGKETRQKIRDTSIEAKNRTVEFANQTGDSARQGVQTIVEQGKESVHHIVDGGKERIHQASEQVKSAVETGRKVSADVRSKIAGSIPGVDDAEETEEA